MGISRSHHVAGDITDAIERPVRRDVSRNRQRLLAAAEEVVVVAERGALARFAPSKDTIERIIARGPVSARPLET